jgi:hypothetical protein
LRKLSGIEGSFVLFGGYIKLKITVSDSVFFDQEAFYGLLSDTIGKGRPAAFFPAIT